ncbi:hypothetical protein QMA77_02530 [Pantoea ananatis]|uniref:hypothetical protein n=1 Tax=Pantoea TaxID=53335 RepID=UPI000FEC6051|nr:hypothetical protein [Pantoea ananatis]MDI6535818.1 hypothetical protein [Pantoea ananatis]QAB30804.1 hypothetical protein EPK90_13890 [Pantoea ananatis]
MNIAGRLLFPLCCLYSSYSCAENWFLPCAEALDKPGFSLLKKYVESRSGSTASIPEKNDTCFRLNNYQFLVNENTEGIYFYDAKRSTYGKDIPGLRMYTEIKQEFTGGNHKHYALIYSSNTNFRYSDLYQKYEILSLIAGNSEKPYTRYTLFDWYEDPSSGLCGTTEPVSDDKSASSEVSNKKIPFEYDVSKPRIINQNNADVAIYFHVKEQNCTTSAIREYDKKFIIINGLFKDESVR